MKYKHLSLDERVELYSQIKQGISLRAIALKLGRTHTSLSRELRRHTKYGRSYKPVLAHRRATRWAFKQRYKAPMKSPEILNYALAKLRLGWGPEIIAGRIGIDHHGLSTSYESIYRWIYSKPWKKHKLWQHLECGRPRRHRKHGRQVTSKYKLLDTKSIDLRSIKVNNRRRVGHWETDLIEGSRGSSAALSITVERKARYVKIKKVKDKTGESKFKSLVKQLESLPTFLRVSITADRGPENRDHLNWETKLGVKVYFCHAYHSWEKGTVENTIKRGVRRFIPKGESMSQYTVKEVQTIEDWINHRPMKCLQYLTPYEKIHQIIKRSQRK